MWINLCSSRGCKNASSQTLRMTKLNLTLSFSYLLKVLIEFEFCRFRGQECMGSFKVHYVHSKYPYFTSWNGKRVWTFFCGLYIYRNTLLWWQSKTMFAFRGIKSFYLCFVFATGFESETSQNIFIWGWHTFVAFYLAICTFDSVFGLFIKTTLHVVKSRVLYFYFLQPQ